MAHSESDRESMHEDTGTWTRFETSYMQPLTKGCRLKDRVRVSAAVMVHCLACARVHAPATTGYADSRSLGSFEQCETKGATTLWVMPCATA